MKKMLFFLVLFVITGCATKQATKEVIITKTPEGKIQYRYIYKGRGNIGTEDILDWANAVNIIKDKKETEDDSKQKGREGKLVIINVSYKKQKIYINSGLSQKTISIPKMTQKTIKIRSKEKIYIKNGNKQAVLPAKHKKTITIKGSGKIIIIYLSSQQ